MRAIKFLAWDKCHKEMVYEVNDIDFDDHEVYFKNCFVHSFPDEAELMQWTGLKDRNGKEIYEGDIMIQPGKYEKEKYVVEWFDEAAAFFIRGIRGSQAKMGMGFTRNMEVIGNVHENPELLKGDK